MAVIVGPVSGSTAGYIRDAEAAANEALKYTPNVVKVYSPNATWEAAKAAMQGASIVIYMGHGNGFPSPYTSTLAPDRQNGLGVNPTAGVNDSTTRYYGEQFLRNEVRLAPGAIVFFGHLCYASGSSEPGKADPTLDQAKQRVDNYAAGFLAIGARAVIAEAYGSAFAPYIASLFTTHQSISDMWLTSRTKQGTPFSFASTRTPGALAQMDPDRNSGRYYRAIVGDPTFTTDDVWAGTAGSWAPATPITPATPTPLTPSGPGTTVPIASPTNPGTTSPGPTSPSVTNPGAPSVGAVPAVPAPPARFSVPGNATVVADLAPVFTDASLAPDPATGAPMALLPLGTPVRIVSVAGTAPDGTTLYAVSANGGAANGVMLASTLQPADSLAPILLSVSVPTAFSPNGDGLNDTVSLSATLNEPSNWDLSIAGSGGATLASQRGSGTTALMTWDGRVNGAPVADGTYTWRVTAIDAAGNGPVVRTGTIVVDKTPPPMTTSTSPTMPLSISPNGDGVNDAWGATFALGPAGGTVDATVSKADGTAIRRLTATTGSSSVTVTWNGRGDDGTEVPDGTYTIAITGRDAAGNTAPSASFPVVVYRALAAVTTSLTVINPHDGDTLATSTRLGFMLRQPATVTWKILDAAGQTVLSKYDAKAFEPRSLSMAWTGVNQAGAAVPPGRYDVVLSVTNGTLTDTVRTRIVVGAFALTPNVATVKRGGSFTITAVSAERLKAAPEARVHAARAHDADLSDDEDRHEHLPPDRPSLEHGQGGDDDRAGDRRRHGRRDERVDREPADPLIASLRYSARARALRAPIVGDCRAMLAISHTPRVRR